MMNTAKSRLFFTGLLLFAAVYLFLGTGHVQLVDWDENIYAEASRQMVERGDYLNVYINNHLFAEKPPFYFWEQVVSYALFGMNEFAARFPSGVAGLLSICLFYHIGRRLGSPQFGLLWGLVYLTSFLPSVFGRVAVIDHTFNLFIASGAYFLYLFDDSYRQSLSNNSNDATGFFARRRYLIYLTAASIAMGLGFLTKGPLGGVIPLVSFAGYKLLNRQPAIRVIHFLYCAALSLSLALSWYIVNWIITGESFIEGFIRFQLMLFSKPLEGHTGPFFYHFVVAFFGLLPWTVLLFMVRPGKVAADNRHFTPLFALGVTWVGFVLLLFSLVSTKLPHYSASIYIPLSMVVAFNLQHAIKNGNVLSRWVTGLLLLTGLGLSAFFAAVPAALKVYADVQMVPFPEVRSVLVYLVAFGMAIAFLVGSVFLRKRQIIKGISIFALAMFLFTQGIWRLHLPVFIEIHQKPLIELVLEAHARSERVFLYRMVSFAAFHYGKKPVEVLHNYKFPGNPEALNQRQLEDVYIITDISYSKRLQKDHPLAEPVRQNGRFVLFKIERRN